MYLQRVGTALHPSKPSAASPHAITDVEPPPHHTALQKEKGCPVTRTALSGYHAPDVLLEAAVVQAGVEAVAQIELAHQHVVACHVGFPVLEQLGQLLRMPGSQVAALGRILGQVVQLPLGGAVRSEERRV